MPHTADERGMSGPWPNGAWWGRIGIDPEPPRTSSFGKREGQATMRREMSVRRTIPGALAGCALLVFGLAGCGSQATEPKATATPGATTTTSTSAPANSSSTRTTSGSSAGSSPRDLPATEADKAALVAAFVAFTHDPASDIEGTEPGSVYYAYLPSTRAYWALARFLPSATASQNSLVSLQDGGNIGIFSRQAGGGWTMLSIGGEPFCPTKSVIPSSVQGLWGLTEPGTCG